MSRPGSSSLQPVLLVVSAGVVVLALGLRLLRRNRHRWRLPLSLPERAEPLLGHVRLLGSLEGLREVCVEAASPEGVSRLSLVGRPVLSILRADHVRTFLGLSSFRKRVPLFKQHTDKFLGPNALVFLMHAQWRQVRRTLSQPFSWESLRDTVADINATGELFVQSLARRRGDVVDMAQLCKCITVDVIGKAAFGHDFDCCRTLTLSRVVQAFEFLSDELTKRAVKDPLNPFNFFYWLPSERNRKFAECSGLVRTTIDEIVKRRVEARGEEGFEEHRDILKFILDALEGEKTRVDPEVIADNLMTFLFAGYDTSSITLAYAFAMIAKHPEIAARVRTEVLGVIGDSGDLTYQQVTGELLLCTAVINETLRLFPPAPITTRNLEEPYEFRINDSLTETIPAGTMIFIPIWWVHRSPLNFDRPEEFDPDRFLDPSRADCIHRFAHIPFSGGARDCIGRRFAMIELVAVFAAVMRRLSFEWSPLLSLSPEIHGFTQRNAGGIPLKVLCE